MTIYGADLSHYQTVTNWSQVKTSGHSFVVLKATEATNYVDTTFSTRRAQAHAAGLIVGFYHFARAGNVAAEAAWFLKTIGTLQTGEFLVLDWEVPAPVGGAPAWCKQWLDIVYAATGVRSLIYMNSSTVANSNWSSVSANYGLWLAKYDNAATTFNSVSYWGAPAMKQFSDKGTVAGVSGTLDVDSFNGTEAQLLKYGKQPAPSPAPNPTPTPAPEDDMAAVPQNEWTDVHSIITSPAFLAAMQQLTSESFSWDKPWPATGGGWVTQDGTNRRLSWLDITRDVQAKAAQLQHPTATVDPTALAAALAADDTFISKLADALVKRNGS